MIGSPKQKIRKVLEIKIIENTSKNKPNQVQNINFLDFLKKSFHTKNHFHTFILGCNTFCNIIPSKTINNSDNIFNLTATKSFQLNQIFSLSTAGFRLANQQQNQFPSILLMISLHLALIALLILPYTAEFCSSILSNNLTILSAQNCQTFHQIFINVGIPYNPLPFLIDTGSLISWIPTKDCNCGSAVDPLTSKSFQTGFKTHNIKYADGDSIFGVEGSQKFSFSNSSLVNVKVPLIFVTKKMAPMIGDRGILALGYSADNIFDAAYKQGIISQSAFVLQFRNNPLQSVIYFDTLPKDIVQKSIYVPIAKNQNLWAIQCDGIKVNGNNYSKFASQTILIDSGSTITSLNQQLYAELMQSVFKSCQKPGPFGGSAILCPLSILIPKIEILTKGGSLYLDPKYYTNLNGNYIQIHLMHSKKLILGSSFFQNYAITFDKKGNKIGFYNSDNKNPPSVKYLRSKP